MCGCGICSLRYLAEAEAEFVMENDANENYREIIVGNISRVSSGSEEGKRWEVNHLPATSGSSYLRVALDAVKLGGLLYITSTDGVSSGGHRPQQSLAAYGAYVRPLPYTNEIGLRMLIGGAVREASVLGYHVVPLFSYYSYHGPVFRVLLQVKRGKSPSSRLSSVVNLYRVISLVLGDDTFASCDRYYSLSAIATGVGALEHFPGMNLVRSDALVVQMYAFGPHRISTTTTTTTNPVYSHLVGSGG
ncbi:hypothetical protein CQW23_14117 [Capsicum baccatum]|uniref:Uncharacterized protein n=1 Tax=Capsicum baccatum TaxID=33114 RepID=A0A2G2WIG7_CAPBA|nr:hypothetical protein CQW23_14117 [Capsicum baccatum]